ncbi:MAG: mevalonate kinase [Vicinamibacteria bacterium]
MRDSRSPTPNGVRGRAFARAALLGNPSDGFGGKTIGFTFAELAAEVTLVAGAEASTGEPEARHLIDATIARFSRDAGIELPPLAATVRTEIPREVGLGGSSALVTATLRALCTLAAIELDPPTTAAIALAVETEDLGIAAGPQDRLIQAHEGLLYMDFSSSAAGDCERLDPAALPPLFVAWRGDAGAPSSDVHADLRRRYRQGDRATESTLDEIAALAERGRRCLAAGDAVALGALMEENVAARGRLVDLDPRHLRLVELASALGAPANYAGSGGAIVGLIPAQIAIEDLRGAFAAEGCELCPATPAGDGFSA